MSIAVLFLLIALILFVLSAAGVSSRINLQSAGLAFVVASMLVGQFHL
jgi:hypothetical protein